MSTVFKWTFLDFAASPDTVYSLAVEEDGAAVDSDFCR